MSWMSELRYCLLVASLAACETPRIAAAPATEGERSSLERRPNDEKDDHPGPLPLSRFEVGGDDDACEASPYRAFDFWVGRWNVSQTGSSNLAGTNVVTRTVDGCAIEEHWSDVAGVRGRSLNSYDAGTRAWHQLWMDETGGSLELSGTGDGLSMQLAGTHPTNPRDPTPFTDRITWTSVGHRLVRQLGEASVDGAPFSTVYDLTYRAVPREEPIAPSVPQFCSSLARPRYHAFDFLLGAWSVGPLGSRARMRTAVRTDLGGCLVEERMRGPGGYAAVAYSGFRSTTFVWNWMFMDNRGVQLLLSGPATLTGTSMVMSGRKIDAQGTPVDVRVEWVSTAPNQVEQRWSFSTDSGATWSTPEVMVMTK